MTFRHVVCLRWADGTTDEEVARLREMLVGLPAAIPELRRYHFGHDARAAEGNYDFAIVADFDDREGWRAYQEHAEHERVLDYVRSLADDRVAVQFELDA
ncbi:MAG: Dabb family protein [Acidimicrobiia bacterium]